MAASGKRKATQDGEQQQAKRAKTGGFVARVRELLFPWKSQEQIGGGRVDASQTRTHLPTRTATALKRKPFDLTSDFTTLQRRPRARPQLFSHSSGPLAPQHSPAHSTPQASTSLLPRAVPSPRAQKLSPVTIDRHQQQQEYKWALSTARAAGRSPPPKPIYAKKRPMGSREDDQRRKRENERSRHELVARAELERKAAAGQLNLEQFKLLVHSRDSVSSAFSPAPSLHRNTSYGPNSSSPRRPLDSLDRALRNVHLTAHEPERPVFSTYDEIRDAVKETALAGTRRRAFPKKLTDEEQAEVEQIHRMTGIVSTMTGGEVKQEDMKNLKGLTWLNDEILTFYAVMINARNKVVHDPDYDGKLCGPASDFCRAYSFTSFFWSKYAVAKYAGVKRWTKRVDIFALDIVIVPINIKLMHWVCAAINMKLKRFEYYDSLGHRDSKVYKVLRKYIQEEHLDKKKKEIDLTDWTDYWNENLPQQRNASDCGVFTCQFMESLSRGVEEFDFTQEQMPYFRNKMALEIKRKEFIREPWL